MGEVLAEFTQRRATLDGTSEEAVPETNVSQDVYDEKSVHRGVTGEMEDPFACVARFGLSKSSDYEFSADEYSMTMSVADENENRVKMQVNILDAGEGKHVVEAVKISGDRFQFNDIFKEMKSFFAAHVNAKQ